MSNDVYTTIQDYVSSICKIWFGDPMTVENWYKKNTNLFAGIRATVNSFEAKLNTLEFEHMDQVKGERCSPRKTI